MLLNAQKTSSPSTQEGLLRVVPATFPGRQEHLTVCERSSMRFLLQHRWAAITSQVPPSADRHTDRGSGHKTAVTLLLVIQVVQSTNKIYTINKKWQLKCSLFQTGFKHNRRRAAVRGLEHAHCRYVDQNNPAGISIISSNCLAVFVPN